MYTDVLITLEETASQISDPETLGIMLDVQGHLEDHNLNWLMLEIITGYGNLVALAIVGSVLLLRRVLFRKLPVVEMIHLILPSLVCDGISRITDQFGVDFEQQPVK